MNSAGIDYSQFNMPADFQTPKALSPSRETDGVNTFQYSDEGYVAWRFAYVARPWKIEKVRKYGLEASDTVPVLLFYRDEKNQVPVQLRRKKGYEEKLDKFGERFDKSHAIQLTEEEKAAGVSELECWELPIGFESEIFQIAFEQWKEKGTRPGTSIANWRANPGQANTLSAMGIFTVEQFGELAEEEFKRKIKTLPPSASSPLLELHDAAIAFVATQSGLVDAAKFGNKIEALESANEQLVEAMEEKDAEIARLMAKIRGDEPVADEEGDGDEDEPLAASSDSDEVVIVDGKIQGV